MTTLELVRDGWRHLQAQRPLAAWASWQAARRAQPESAAAAEALRHLANAPALPRAATRVYHFQPAPSPAARERWGQALGPERVSNLTASAEAFQGIADDSDDDAPARFNEALSWAWAGENAAAVAALERYLVLTAPQDFERAVDAWTLAEVLRQGAGAEHLADEMTHALEVPWPHAYGPPLEWLEHMGELRPLPNPVDPVTRRPVEPHARLFECLDRPMPEPAEDLALDDLPHVLASLVQTPGLLRFSSPAPGNLRRIEQALFAFLDDDDPPLDRASRPLPFALLDARAWLVRMPDGLDAQHRRRLLVEAAERHFNDDWPHVPRIALAGPPFNPPDRPITPLELARRAQQAPGPDTAIARAKLEAVVRFREQLAARPIVAELYQGFSFDSLRRRLGLEAEGPNPSETTP